MNTENADTSTEAEVRPKKRRVTRKPPEQLYASDLDLAVRFAVDRSTIWRWAKEPGFPPKIFLSPGCARWRLSDIEAWEAARAAEAGAA